VLVLAAAAAAAWIQYYSTLLKLVGWCSAAAAAISANKAQFSCGR